ncbi:hypothetical protein ZIOFF_055138 [Zingiber officinale]|uniref:SHSP domain-containing protein n=1 Tax=Zingiber officinale TaxID=94328 RepID=A0A8J5KNA1_ZINOF|nr:hypothetical protein ZIOFF_055138 [Zingiber officinale]
MSTTPSALQASENFEPSSEWVHEEAFRTLLIYLPGFKREHIKVQISNNGYINISGERPLDGQRRSKFIKQYPLPEHCKVAQTRAKFENETLQVRFSIAQDVVTLPLVPTPIMHKPPSSPMERTTTQQGEKAQERNGKSQKAVPEEEELRRKKQSEAKEEIGRKGQPKATGIQEKKQEKLQDKGKSEEGRSNSDMKQDYRMSPALKTEGRSKSDVKQGQQITPSLKPEEGRSNGDKKQGQQMSPALKTEDTSSLEKKQALHESSSFPSSNGKGTVTTAKYSIDSLFMGLPPAKKTLLVNVVVAGLVCLGIGLYLRSPVNMAEHPAENFKNSPSSKWNKPLYRNRFALPKDSKLCSARSQTNKKLGFPYLHKKSTNTQD